MPVSSASSSSGISRSSRRSLPTAAVSLSRWLETDTYSPSAIETAPATSPASPAVKIGPRAAVAPATPTTIPATDTMPSLAPAPRPGASSAARPFPRRRGSWGWPGVRRRCFVVVHHAASANLKLGQLHSQASLGLIRSRPGSGPPRPGSGTKASSPRRIARIASITRGDLAPRHELGGRRCPTH